MSEIDYIKQLEKTVESLSDKNAKLEKSIEESSYLLGLKPKWTFKLVLLRGHKRRTKVHVYGCVGIFDYAYIKPTKNKFLHEVIWCLDYRSCDLFGQEIEDAKIFVESHFRETCKLNDVMTDESFFEPLIDDGGYKKVK